MIPCENRVFRDHALRKSLVAGFAAAGIKLVAKSPGASADGRTSAIAGSICVKTRSLSGKIWRAREIFSVVGQNAQNWRRTGNGLAA
ncbi:hypothetical protein CH337_09050 [Rhodoblastus acidophilus]|nr:hypothetical protein CKO16_09155 [Rhodoblastus acidophilus]RAI20767.1 hypothetical protein CH337_09050 [Rhodoblastus acidophilus]